MAEYRTLTPEEVQQAQSLFRAGISHSDIARKFGVTVASISCRAKKAGWVHDLMYDVRARTEALVIMGQNDPNLPPLVDPNNEAAVAAREEQIIETAAAKQAAVLGEHKASLLKLKTIEDKYMAELGDNPTRTVTTTFEGNIFTKEVPLHLVDRTMTLESLSRIMARRIAMERQACGIDDQASVEDPFAAIINMISVTGSRLTPEGGE